MKNKLNKIYIGLGIIFSMIISFLIGYSPINAVCTPAKTGTAASKPAQNYISTSSLTIVSNPNNYLNKNVKFNAVFDKFSSLGLDYKKAMRSSQDYIGILIKRDDVTDHTVPLSEMKLFLKRKEAEKFIDLESGDKIQIEGKVFSTALGDPWIEINKLTVLNKINKKADTK